jgi:hypothetical protein
MRRVFLLLVLGSLTIVASLAGPAVRTVFSQSRQLSPVDFRGTYAGKSVGFTTVCTNSGGCSASSPALLQKNFAAVTQAAFDEEGNFCGTATAASAPVAGSPSPVDVSVRVITGELASFDPANAAGEVSFNIYKGGSCDGAIFESSGATLTTTGSAHVVVSDLGMRINGVVETYIGTADQFGSVLNNVTLFRQKLEDERHESKARRGENHERFSLADQRGVYTVKSVGFETLCINGCTSALPLLLPLNFAADAQGTVDEAGNTCAVATSASSPVNGSASGAFVFTKIITGGVTSFDPATGQADVYFYEYKGGSCNGASFDGRGATLVATGTNHLVISESGNRIDALATSYVSKAGKIGGVVNLTTFIRLAGDSAGEDRH